MKYLGSKRRIAKHILPIMEEVRGDRVWVEPFVGGCNSIDKVKGRRIGADINYYLIALFQALQKGWLPPTEVTREEYMHMKNNKTEYPPELIGFAGFNCAFGAYFFSGYARCKRGDNYALRGHNNLLKQLPNIQDVEFYHCSYEELDIPRNSLIYCDPPYAKTTTYKNSEGKIKRFNHERFFEWCIQKKADGHIVFLSEADAPFECLWEKDIEITVSNKDITDKRSRIERLYRI